MDQQYLDSIPHLLHEIQDICGKGRRKRIMSLRVRGIGEGELQKSLSIVFRQCGEVALGCDRDSCPGAIAPEQCGVVG